jgi:DNA-binding transcriptional ArsR family regulator
MPEPTLDLIATPTRTAVSISLEPAQNTIQSLTLLSKADDFSGLGEWVASTWAALSPEEREIHTLVMWGFYYAFLPDRSWPSFPAFLRHLEALSPERLLDRMLDVYAGMPLLDISGQKNAFPLSPMEAKVEMLRSFDAYLAFLQARFCEGSVVPELEKRAFAYVQDPPAMQRLIVSHLRKMWVSHLAAEWERVQPMLLEAVRASQEIGFAEMDRLEAARALTGQELEEKHRHNLENARQVIFVPNAHIGPYLRQVESAGTLWLIYGARLPRGASFDASDLSRAEMLVRLSALADDGRLRILRLIAERGELRSSEVMQSLEMSQPTASRHLTQLTATGYLTERRCEGAKCYDLNPDRIEETLQAIRTYLIPASRRPRLARRVA